MRRWMMAVAMVALMGPALVGCGSSDDTPDPTGTTVSGADSTSSSSTTSRSSSTTSAARPTDAELEPMLLEVDDLPAGWTVRNSLSSEDDSSTPECLRQFDTASNDRPSADIEFEQGDTRYLNEDLTWIGEDVDQAFSTAVDALDDCGDLTVDLGDGVQADVSISRTSFPSYGDDSAAYHMTLAAKGERVGFDIVLVRQDPYVLVLLTGAFDAADTAPFLQQLTTKALDKLPAGT